MELDPDPRIHASDKWIRIRILDPDPAIFVIDLQDASKKLIFNTIFFCLLLLEATFTSFFKAGSGSIPLTSGSGSGMPKNMWIRWIRIRIRNRNTAHMSIKIEFLETAKCDQAPDLRIRIRIVIKSFIRIRIETNADPQHCLLGTLLPYFFLLSVNQFHSGSKLFLLIYIWIPTEGYPNLGAKDAILDQAKNVDEIGCAKYQCIIYGT
jgi:hypothetical protein